MTGVKALVIRRFDTPLIVTHHNGSTSMLLSTCSVGTVFSLKIITVVIKLKGFGKRVCTH